MKGFCCAVALSVVASAAVAQNFPSKEVRLISNVRPGSAPDVMARIIAQKLELSLGQSVIVENHPEFNRVDAAALVASDEPDGHTVIVYTSVATVPPKGRRIFELADLTAVAAMVSIPTVLVASTSKGYTTVGALVMAAKANPRQIVAATAGIGTATHMSLERFRIAADIEVSRLHMNGPREALAEVLLGRADFYFALPLQLGADRKDGKIVALAVASPRRSAVFPDLPTTIEAGLPNSDYAFWVGAMVASRTPRAIVLRLHEEFNAAISASDVRARILKLGAEPLKATLPEFEQLLREQSELNAQLVEAANVKPN